MVAHLGVWAFSVQFFSDGQGRVGSACLLYCSCFACRYCCAVGYCLASRPPRSRLMITTVVGRLFLAPLADFAPRGLFLVACQLSWLILSPLDDFSTGLSVCDCVGGEQKSKSKGPMR